MANKQVQDLQSALESFKDNVSEFNRFNAVDQANAAVQKIRASAESEANKRNALQNIANDLVGRLAIAGTPATTIQQVAGAIAPQQFKSPEEAALSGELTGKPEVTAQAVSADRAIREPREEAQLQRDLIKAGAQERAAGAKAKKEALKLPPTERSKINASFDVLGAADELGAMVNQFSDLERVGLKAGSARFKKEYAKLKAKGDLFKTKFTRALSQGQGQISDMERKLFNDIVGNIDDFKSASALKGAYESFKEAAYSTLDTSLSTLEGEEKNVEHLRQRAARFAPAGAGMNRVVSAPSGAAPQAAGPVIKVMRNAAGQRVEVEVMPNGKVRLLKR